MESPWAGCAAPWGRTQRCIPRKMHKAHSGNVSLFFFFFTCSKRWNKLSPSKPSRARSVEKYNLGSPGRATDKKKSCLLITVQTEIRSPSAGGGCLCVSWNNKTHYLAADQLYNLSRHLTEGHRERLQHKAGLSEPAAEGTQRRCRLAVTFAGSVVTLLLPPESCGAPRPQIPANHL